MQLSTRSLAVFAGLFAFWSVAQADDCAVTQIDQRVPIDSVFDGSSFLSGDMVLQLTGIHVPIYARHLQNDQPFGKGIAQMVSQLVKRSKGHLNIELDTLPSHKSKQLIHAYLGDGRNLGLALLKSGYAVVNTQLPNMLHSQCYRQAEAQARAAKKGMWQYLDQGIPVVESAQLTGNHAGFLIVRGKIEQIEFKERYAQLMMDTVVFRIDNEQLALFDINALKGLLGKVVEIRDDYTFHRGHMVATLEHPGQIDLLADDFYQNYLKDSVK